jgi:DNA-binding XRE family transcriptional regulator
VGQLGEWQFVEIGRQAALPSDQILNRELANARHLLKRD